MTVHVLILIFSLSVYGFAPYGFDLKTERALVQQSNLAVAVEEKNISTNVWFGPPQVYTHVLSLSLSLSACLCLACFWVEQAFPFVTESPNSSKAFDLVCKHYSNLILKFAFI